jgi:hypothetical protein
MSRDRVMCTKGYPDSVSQEHHIFASYLSLFASIRREWGRHARRQEGEGRNMNQKEQIEEEKKKERGKGRRSN